MAGNCPSAVNGNPLSSPVSIAGSRGVECIYVPVALAHVAGKLRVQCHEVSPCNLACIVDGVCLCPCRPAHVKACNVSSQAAAESVNHIGRIVIASCGPAE